MTGTTNALTNISWCKGMSYCTKGILQHPE